MLTVPCTTPSCATMRLGSGSSMTGTGTGAATIGVSLGGRVISVGAITTGVLSTTGVGIGAGSVSTTIGATAGAVGCKYCAATNANAFVGGSIFVQSPCV